MHVIDIVDVDINRDMIDRSHRIGKKFVREETEDSDNSEVTKNEEREVPGMSPTRYQQITVRFTSWRARTLVCKKRKSARNKVNGGLRAGITNFNHKIHNPTKISSYGPLSSYVFPNVWLFWYVYFFLALSIITFPLSVCITTIFC